MSIYSYPSREAYDDEHDDDEATTCYTTGGRCHAGCGCDEALAHAKENRK